MEEGATEGAGKAAALGVGQLLGLLVGLRLALGSVPDTSKKRAFFLVVLAGLATQAGGHSLWAALRRQIRRPSHQGGCSVRGPSRCRNNRGAKPPLPLPVTAGSFTFTVFTPELAAGLPTAAAGGLGVATSNEGVPGVVNEAVENDLMNA